MKKESKRLKGYLLFPIVLLMFFVCFIFFCPKFKNVDLEVGTEKINLNSFVTLKMFKKNSKCLTDVSKIDLNKVGNYDIEFSYKGKKQVVKLNIVDTTAPKLEMKDITAKINEEIKAEDFIVSLSDYSEYQYKLNETIDNSKYGETKVSITATDEYNNSVTKIAMLNISIAYPRVEHELGQKFSIDEVLYDKSADNIEINDLELAKVDIEHPGTYELTLKYDDHTFKSKVVVADKTAPTLEVQDKIVYLNEKIEPIKYTDFVKKCEDYSGECIFEYEGNLSCEKAQKNTITIKAKDKYNNEIVKQAIFYVKNDNKGPVISGLKDITVTEGNSVDYLKGVTCKDAIDGTTKCNVNSSGVRLSKEGTYYATYTSTDSEGNTTTSKRKIVVQGKTKAELFDKYMNDYNLKNKNVLEITKVVRSTIGYNHNESSDNVLYALKYRAGNCYVHAVFLKYILDTLGYENVLIYVKDKSHYWNLVKVGGVWRHYDSTPGTHDVGPDTDTQKWNSNGLHGRQWDKSAFPAAI